MKRWSAVLSILALGVAAGALPLRSQQATDSTVQSSPTAKPAPAPVNDSAVQASPEPMAKHVASIGTLAVKTAVPVTLGGAVDSGKLHNGQAVAAKLGADVRTTNGATLRAGVPVTLTVVATAPAGKLASAGEFSLQLVRVGGMDVFTDTQTFRGKQGHRDVADSAPDKGSNATLDAGANLTFHVQPQPTMASGPPEKMPVVPGSVNGTANGAVTPK